MKNKLKAFFLNLQTELEWGAGCTWFYCWGNQLATI